MKKILTVTVPSYNVEKFLENTLDSFVDERVLDDIEAVSYTHLTLPTT